MICRPEALRGLYNGNRKIQDFLNSPAKSYMSRSFDKFFDKVNVDLLFIAYFQVLLNRLLTNYLNGEDIAASRLHYFIPHYIVYKINRYLLAEYQNCLDIMKEMGIVSNTDFLKKMTDTYLNANYEEKMPVFLACSYRLLEKIIEHLEGAGNQKFFLSKRILSISNYDGLILDALLGLKKHWLRHLKYYFRDFFLVGSLSSLDFTPGLSDMDTLLIIKRKTLLAPKSLKKARQAVLLSLPYLFWVDPLQHHGHMVISEVDLRWYPQAFFPPVLLEEGISLGNSAKSLHYVERDCLFERFRNAWMGTSSFMNHNLREDKWKDPYQLKMHLQVAQLIPVLLNQTLGIYPGKPDAFSNLKPHYSEDAWHLVERSTRMRLTGGYDPIRDKSIYKKLVLSKNPRSLQRRARRLGNAEKYLSLVRRYIGSFDEIKKHGQLFAEESFAWLKSIKNSLN